MALYESAGFKVVRGGVSPAEAQRFATELEQIADLPADDHSSVVSGQREPFYRHGAVAATPGLWPLLVHPGLVAAVQTVLGPTAKCLPGIDTAAMHASETEPHRDASPHELPSLVDGPYSGHYSVVRVIMYPASPGERFGVLPGSHRQPGRPGALATANHAAWRWITLQQGDAVLFDPRLVHAGTPVTNPKPMAVLTYGTGDQALETYFHARIRTADLGFTDPPGELSDLLAQQDLLLEGINDPTLWKHFSTAW